MKTEVTSKYKMKTEVTLEQARRVLEVIDCGLVSGLGNPELGEMCVEAAVCFAFGEPHSAYPKCVHENLADLKVELNDARWSNNEARTAGMRRLAIAQLGTAGTLDPKAFRAALRIEGTRRLTPLCLRVAAAIARLNGDEKQAEKTEKIATQCEAGLSPDEAQAAIYGLHANPNAYANAYADTTGFANAYANVVTYATTYANAVTYGYAYTNAVTNAYAYANAYANAYTNAPNPDNYAKGKDDLLRALADAIVAALRICNSPGIALMDKLIPSKT